MPRCTARSARAGASGWPADRLPRVTVSLISGLIVGHRWWVLIGALRRKRRVAVVLQLGQPEDLRGVLEGVRILQPVLFARTRSTTALSSGGSRSWKRYRSP